MFLLLDRATSREQVPAGLLGRLELGSADAKLLSATLGELSAAVGVGVLVDAAAGDGELSGVREADDECAGGLWGGEATLRNFY